jgi:hypothetical protein
MEKALLRFCYLGLLRVLAVRCVEDLHEAGVHGLAPPAHAAEEQRAGDHQTQASYKLRNKEAALHTKKERSQKLSDYLRAKQNVRRKKISVADPYFCLSRIPDPKTATKEKGEKKICCPTFFL